MDSARHATVAIMDRRLILEDPLTPLDLEQEFDDVAAVAASLGNEVDLFGHSSGGDVALWAGLRMNNLRRLVLYESGLGPEEGRAETLAFAETMSEIVLEFLQADEPAESKAPA